jgi:chromate transporter
VAIYGGGFALATFLQQDVVERLGWISARELLDAIAIGQSTPGPVFTTATFIGYLVGGIPGAIAATIGIFTPAFIFVLLENALLGRVTNQPAFKLFLQGVNAAVVASLVVSIGQLGSSALPDVFTLMVCIVAFVALTWKKIDAHWIVSAALLIGIGRLAFGM